MLGLPRGSSSCPLAHVCHLDCVKTELRQNREESEIPAHERVLSPPGAVWREYPFPSPPAPEGQFPVLAAVLGPLPSQSVYFPRMVGGQLEKSSPGSATRHLLT